MGEHGAEKFEKALSREQISDHFRFKFDPKTREKLRIYREKLGRRETRDRVGEYFQLASLNRANNFEDDISLFRDGSRQEKMAVNQTMMQEFMERKTFRKFLKDTRQNYQSRVSANASSETEKSFVLEEGGHFIRIMSDRYFSLRIKKFIDDEKLASPLKLDEKIFDFIHDPLFEQQLFQYSRLNMQQKAELFGTFKNRCGLGNLPLQSVRLLFEDIVQGFEQQFFANSRWRFAHGKMIKMADNGEDENLDDDSWDEMIDEEEQKNATGEYKQAMEEGRKFVSSVLDLHDTKADDQPIASAKDAAEVSGAVRIDSYDSQTNRYTLTYPGSFQVEMEIDMNGAHGFSDAKYVFYDKNADNAGPVVVDQKDLRKAVNRMVLDHLAVNEVLPRMNFHDDYNKIFSDDVLAFACEKLFGKSLNEIAVSPQRAAVFEQLVMILANTDGASEFGDLNTFSQRVDKLRIVLNSGDFARRIYDFLEKQTLDINRPTRMTLTALLAEKIVDYPKG